MGDPHQDKTHRLTGGQMAIPLNLGGSCSYLYPLYNETLRGCFTVGEKKKYQKIDD